jgi:hypothetical protein
MSGPEVTMHSSEAEQLEPCAACTDAVSSTDRTFVIGDGAILCFQCALDRGGRYDERHDRWERAPDVVDLLERPRDA